LSFLKENEKGLEFTDVVNEKDKNLA